MEFGSAFALSQSVNPAVNFEEIDETDYSGGVRVAMERNISSRADNMCLLDIIDTYVCLLILFMFYNLSASEPGRRNTLRCVNSICGPHKHT